MWSAALLRFIRRRIVLAAIFCMSLTYFLISLMQNGVSLEADDFEIKRERPLLWRTQFEPRNFTNATKCRNSVQGILLLVDDRGVVCQRGDLLAASGCCDPDAATASMHNCDTCSETHCCSIYEHCVSCCLNPDKRPLLEQVLVQATGRQRAVFATVSDHFELCLAKCRTDSHSVQHENQYRRPGAKHCYGLTFAHESQRDVANSGGAAVGAPAAGAAAAAPPESAVD